jgi:hypothetical protein
MTEENVLATGTAPESAAPEATDWRASLSEDYRDKYTEFKDPNSLMKGYEGLVSKLGQNPIVKPKDDAPQDVKDAYYKSLKKELGAPDDVKAYEFQLPKDAPEGFVDTKQLEEMKQVFLDEGISPQAAQKILDKYLGMQLQGYEQLQSDQASKSEESINQLKKDWKGEYDGNLVKAQKFAENYYSEETVSKFGNDPDFIKDTLSLYNKMAEGRIESEGSMGQVQTPADLRAEAVQLMKSSDAQNAMSPNYNTVHARVRELYKRAGDMETKANR